MSNLLIELQASRLLNNTVFPPHLFVYDDLLVYRKRNLIKRWERTINYNHISQVNLVMGIFFAGLEIICHATEPVALRYVSKEKAARAKKIIDQKIFYSHAKHKPDTKTETPESIYSLEKTLNRLKELEATGKITRSEYEKRRERLFEK